MESVKVQSAAATDSACAYLCPGETHFISRPVHLARLAASYSACRNCASRNDSPPNLPAANFARGADTTAAELFGADTVGGASARQLDAPTVRRLALAAAICWRKEQTPSGKPPAVVVAADGRAETVELVAAAVDGVRLGGCRATDLGTTSRPATAFGITRLAADGGLYIGNPSGEPAAVGISFWGREAEVWSAGGRLDALDAIFLAGVQRPVRRSGDLVRRSIDAEYLAEKQSLFHALRPLRLLVDTASLTTRRHIDALLARTGCRTFPLEMRRAAARGRLPTGVAAKQAAKISFAARRLEFISRRVVEIGADVGVWIDGDGAVLKAVDERGRPVADAKLAASNPAAADAVESLGRLLTLLSHCDRPASEVLDGAASAG